MPSVSDDDGIGLGHAVDKYLKARAPQKKDPKAWEKPPIIGGSEHGERSEGLKSRTSVVSSKDAHRVYLEAHGEKVFNYNEPLFGDVLPEMVKDFFALIDLTGDGKVSGEDLVALSDMANHFLDHNSSNSGELCYLYFSDTVKQALSVWDEDDSGTVSVTELLHAAAAQKKMRSEMGLLKRMLFGSILVIIILCGATFALSFTAAELAKETKTEGAVLVDASTKKPVAMMKTKSTIPLLNLAEQSDSVLASVKQLTLKATTGETFGVTIQEFKRSKPDEVEMYSASGTKVVVSKTSAYVVSNGQTYTLKTHDSSGRRLAAGDGGGFGYAEFAQDLSPEQNCDMGACASPNDGVGNIQDWDCDFVQSDFDCGAITKCNWDSQANKCAWRCQFLEKQTDCTTKGAAPVSKTRGCHWFPEPSEITGKQCQVDCTKRSSYDDCTKSPSCMWTGKFCAVSCLNYYTRGDCLMGSELGKEKGHCVWEQKKDAAGSCKHDCQKRPDRLTCDPAGTGDVCEWDDCKRQCKDTTKVVQWDETWKRKFQLDSDCLDRGVNSRWYWNYQCTGAYSHCYIEDYKTKTAMFPKGNKCDFSTFDLKHCQPDCEALNKLALDPKYALAEPTFDTSLEKAKYFCEQEKASCSWNKGKCEWKQSCDEKWPVQILNSKPALQQQTLLNLYRMDMCDEHTCDAARSGGGASPIDLHGRCAAVKVVTGVGRLRRARCFTKCELRESEKQCMSPGEGGRLKDEYMGTPCGPMKLDDDGKPDAVNGRMKFPQQCVSMCRWLNNKCMTSCEFRQTKDTCTGTCKWDGDKNTGVLEYGGLPDLISCTGKPSVPLSIANLKQKAENTVKSYTEKGGAGLVGPVSECILNASMTTGKHDCYNSVKLGIDTRYEKLYVAPDPNNPAPPVDPNTCVKDPPHQIMSPTIKMTMKNTMDANAVNKFAICPFRKTFKTALAQGFAKALNFELFATGYVIRSEWVAVQDLRFEGVDASGAFVMMINIRANLPRGHRPSGVMDVINGNPSRQMVALFKLGSVKATTFVDQFKEQTFSPDFETELFGDEKWKWEIATSFEAGAYVWPPRPTLATIQPVTIPADATLKWKVKSGRCKVDADGCATSPNYPKVYADSKTCKIEVTAGGAVQVPPASFRTELCTDYLSVGGTQYSGEGAELHGKSIATGSELIWSSDSSMPGTGWRICPGPTTTTTTTVAPPSGSSGSGSSGSGSSGSGTGSGTGSGGATGSCPTVTGTASWVVLDGACTIDATGCALSPNYPDAYDNSQSCMFAVDTDAKIKSEFFSTEDGYDMLSITGAPADPCLGDTPSDYGYSGVSSPDGVYVGASSSISWYSDDSATGEGFKLCLTYTR